MWHLGLCLCGFCKSHSPVSTPRSKAWALKVQSCLFLILSQQPPDWPIGAMLLLGSGLLSSPKDPVPLTYLHYFQYSSGGGGVLVGWFGLVGEIVSFCSSVRPHLMIPLPQLPHCWIIGMYHYHAQFNNPQLWLYKSQLLFLKYLPSCSFLC